MTDIAKFSNDVWNSFSSLGLLQKCIVGTAIGYGTFKLTADVLQNVGILLFRLTRKRNNPKDPKYDPDKVYLHMFPRSVTKQVPNLSPFAIKLETWLRMTGIEHEVVETRIFSNATRQIPYINYKGKEITDSDLIIEYLEKDMELDNTEGLSLEEVGVSRAYIKMSEESMAWTYIIHRYCFDFPGFRRIYSTPWSNPIAAALFSKIFPKVMLNFLYSRGIGRKTRAEVYHIGQEDILAISRFLGTKSYMMGDKMTKVDCAIFGHLCQIVYVDFHYPHMDFIKDNCQNILPYMNRIKDKYWPDWDKIVPKGHFF